MDRHRAPAHSVASCCQAWWGSLTPVQRTWLHSRFWDLEILAGWTSDMMVGDLLNGHDDRTGRYSPGPDRLALGAYPETPRDRKARPSAGSGQAC